MMNNRRNLDPETLWHFFNAKYASEGISAGYKRLTNNIPIPSVSHAEKVGILINAVENGNWSDPIFDDEEIIQIALTAHHPEQKPQRLTEQQVSTILERRQNSLSAQYTGAFRILDDSKQFTKEAESILFPAMSASQLLALRSAEQKESFRQLVAALPLSEQFFYTTTLGPLPKDTSLGYILHKIGSIMVHGQQIVHLAAGARDAHGIARFSIDNYFKVTDKLGKLTRSQIEEGNRKETRLATVFVPFADYYKNIHAHTDFTPMEAWYHDYIHALIMSLLPRNFRNVLLHMIDVARSNLNMQWTKAIWTWVDAELHYLLSSSEVAIFQLQNEDLVDQIENFNTASYLAQAQIEPEVLNSLSTTDATSLFCRITSFGRTHLDISSQGNYLFLGNKEITTEGILILIDMIKNRSAWESLKINPACFIQKSNDPNCLLPYQKYFAQIKSIYSMIQHDAPLIQLLKCRIHFLLAKDNKEALSPRLFAYIDENLQAILPRLTFMKVSSGELKQKSNLLNALVGSKLFDAQGVENMVFVGLDNEYLTEEKLSQFIRMCRSEILKKDLVYQPNLQGNYQPILRKSFEASANSNSNGKMGLFMKSISFNIDARITTTNTTDDLMEVDPPLKKALSSPALPDASNLPPLPQTQTVHSAVSPSVLPPAVLPSGSPFNTGGFTLVGSQFSPTLPQTTQLTTTTTSTHTNDSSFDAKRKRTDSKTQ